jgi:hypothetical protein
MNSVRTSEEIQYISVLWPGTLTTGLRRWSVELKCLVKSHAVDIAVWFQNKPNICPFVQGQNAVLLLSPSLHVFMLTDSVPLFFWPSLF